MIGEKTSFRLSGYNLISQRLNANDDGGDGGWLATSFLMLHFTVNFASLLKFCFQLKIMVGSEFH